jgi:twitching motility protein PilT
MELNTLLTELTERDGSDLHLVVGQPPVFRIHGDLVRREGETLDEATMAALLRPHLRDADWETVTEQRTDMETSLRANDRAFRFHVFRERGRLGAAIRTVPQEIPTLDDLYGEVQEGLRATLERISQLPRGLVIVTGPTGSGKTTTCYAMLETINRTAARRIIVLEEHLSYEFTSKQSLVTQRSIGDDIAGYEQGAFWAFHEDLDVIYISEMRTLDTVQYALALAETGHLVIVTLHVQTVSEAVARLIDVFPSPRDLIRRQLARNVAAVIAQQLVPRGDRPGRVALNEVLLATPRIRQMIEQGHDDLLLAIEANRDQGMQTMDDSIVQAYQAGLISYDTAWTRLTDTERLGPRPGPAPP